MKIYVDMDGTIAEWKNIQISIKQEEEKNSVQEELYKILTSPGYYYNLKPYENVLAAVKELIADGEDVYILSCFIPNSPALDDKIAWLKKHLPELDRNHMIFVPDGMNKNDFVSLPDPKDVLLDDYSKNLREWRGTAIKTYNGLNGTKGTWNGRSIHTTDSPSLIKSMIVGANL